MKKLCFFTVFIAILGCAVVTHSTVYEINTATELIELFKTRGEVDGVIELGADLDFSNANLIYPLGADSTGLVSLFSGVLHGNGHSIKNFVIDGYSNQGFVNAGLFAFIRSAVIENLVIDASCSFSGYLAGALSVAAAGSVTVRGVINKASVNGDERVGGFIGRVYVLDSISFDGCINSGSVRGSIDVGGFVGSILSSTSTVVTVTNSENNGTISGYNTGGFVGHMTENTNLRIMFSNSTNNGNITGDSYIGGFIGVLDKNTNMVLEASNTTNNGIITGAGKYIGGFLGNIDGNNYTTMAISNYINSGNVTGSDFAGKFAGTVSNNHNIEVTISDSIHNGTVSANYAGGIIGAITGHTNMTVTISNSIVNGLSTGRSAIGGLLGSVEANTNTTTTISKCTNNGDISVYSMGAGGLIGHFFSNNVTTLVVSESVNNGNALIIGTRDTSVGGLLGVVSDSNTIVNITDCVNNGAISEADSASGFVGSVQESEKIAFTISNWTNNGRITGKGYAGGLVGFVTMNTDSNITISSGINNGIIEGNEGYGGGLFALVVNGLNMNVTLSNNTNNGDVSGLICGGGLIGYILTSNSEEPYKITLDIINNANKGNTSAVAMACGLFYVDQTYCNGVETTVKNSINNGRVSADDYAYGIANVITVARNVVSMGEVTGSSGSFTFWNASTDVALFYGLNDKCFNCSENATLFEHNSETGLYEVVESGEHVDDLLNEESLNESFGMLWTRKLELVAHLDDPSPSSSDDESDHRQSGPLSSATFNSLSSFVVFVFILFSSLF